MPVVLIWIERREMQRLIAVLYALIIIAATSAYSQTNNCSSTLTLPVVKAYNQCRTELCWAYSFLAMVETRFVLTHPGADIVLSRDLLKIYTLLDRRLRAQNGEKFVDHERGTIVDAVELVKKFGPEEFAMLEDVPWISYGFSEDFEGFYLHADSDARPETQSFYLNRTKLPEIIKKSLESKWPLGFLVNGHIAVLYGADFDNNGNAIVYHIVDSLLIGPLSEKKHPFERAMGIPIPENHFYDLPANLLHQHAIEVTTAKLPTNDFTKTPKK
jgi:hypothetical protein